MRGVHYFCACNLLYKIRIIPACAGSTFHCAADTAGREDHPRMRGVHYFRVSTHAPRMGSSPHARGPLSSHSHTGYRDRIIPACAGSTHQGHGYQPGQRDHPRMRGVH